MNLEQQDRWAYFNLSREDQQFFSAFASGPTEASLVKDVPVSALEQVRPILRRLRALSGRRTYIMYRGRKGRYRGQATVWRQDAVKFSVYWRG